MRVLTGVFVMSVFLCGIALCGDVEAKKKGEAAHVWWASDSLWAIGGFGQHRPGLLEQVLALKPEGVDAFKGYELMYREKGEWLGFMVALRKVDKVVFTRDTKVVLYDKLGRRLESEAIIFYPDEYQTSVYDNRRSPIVVTVRSIWCFDGRGQPSGMAKFPLGSIKVDDIASCEVVGAIVDTTQIVARGSLGQARFPLATAMRKPVARR